MLTLPPLFVVFWIFLFGLVLGSFFNVVIYRLPLRQSIVSPRSSCTSCGVPIKSYDNIPVLSYVLLRGRCRNCGERISPIYPAVELLVGLLYVGLYLIYGLTPVFLANVIFVSFIVPLVFIDLEHKLLPDRLTYPGFVVMLIVRVLVPYEPIVSHTRNLFDLATWPDYGVQLVASAMGALAGGGSLWFVSKAYYLVRKVEGMGGGDVKMMLMVGVFLGWQLTVVNLFIATVFGSVIGILVAKIKGSSLKKTEIPFGAFLGPGAIAALLIGQQLIAWYLGRYH
ncbi:MAG TPA: prepilin peptidase [Blastocatellia bacterium]|nr:prepilin peptidase [Blastocatellia bacterium]